MACFLGHIILCINIITDYSKLLKVTYQEQKEKKYIGQQFKITKKHVTYDCNELSWTLSDKG